MNTRIKGRNAEQLAANYLVSQGYKIVERNFYIPSGELDIIAQDGAEIVFVEVRSIDSRLEISPLELLGAQKLRKIARTINVWLIRQDMLRTRWRLDYIGVVLDPQQLVVDFVHLQNLEI